MKNKKYLVFMQDEYNNNWLLGLYEKLNDALSDINDFLKPYNAKLDELIEYTSTFGSCFDKEIKTPNEDFIMVRGFNIENLFNKGELK